MYVVAQGLCHPLTAQRFCHPCRKERVELSQKQIQRIKVIENAAEGRLSVAQAAELLGLSTRQVKRLKRNQQAGGVEWVYHGNRGRAPGNRTGETQRKQVVELARGGYTGFNDTHVTEKLNTVDKLKVSRATVQRILRLPAPHTASGGEQGHPTEHSSRPAQ